MKGRMGIARPERIEVLAIEAVDTSSLGEERKSPPDS